MPYVPLIRRVGDRSVSALRKYQDLFVGSQSMYQLIKYELVISLFSVLPGAVGIFLRNKFYRTVFGGCGRSVFFGKCVTIRVPHRIKLGSNVLCDDNAVLDGKATSDRMSIEIGNDVEISRNSILSTKCRGRIKVGDFVSIGRNALLSALADIHIGQNCSIGPYSCILASGHGWQDCDKPIMLQDRDINDIVIEDNVWIGAHVTVMDGVSIGRNSIIAVGAVVTEDMPQDCIAAGVPARPVTRRKRNTCISGTSRPCDGSVAAPRPQEDMIRTHARNHAGDVRHGQSQEVSHPIQGAEYGKIVDIVYSSIDELNLQRPTGQEINKSLDTALFSPSQRGGVDSLGLLNLIVTTEDKLEEEFHVRINLAHTGSSSSQGNPYATVEEFVDYIFTLLSERNDAKWSL